jgi:hypothetical protein
MKKEKAVKEKKKVTSTKTPAPSTVSQPPDNGKKFEAPKKCGFKCTECKDNAMAAYEVKVFKVINWEGFVCLTCLTQFQRMIHMQNRGKMDFREMGTDTWREFVPAKR